MTRYLPLTQVELFPNLARRMRRFLRSPLGCLACAIVVSVSCGLVVHPRVFILAAGLAVAVAIGVGWPWLSVRLLRGRIEFAAERATEGTAASVAATLANHLPWTARDIAIRGTDDGPLDLPPSRLPPRSETRIEWTVTPGVRGELPGSELAIATGFPFGLRESRRPLAVARPLLVWPRTYAVGPPPFEGNEEQHEGRARSNVVGAGGEVIGVRPYRPGDSVRRIHWRQTAKHDRLVVCERQATLRERVLIVVDLNSDGHSPGPDGSAEWSIRVAASFVKGWLEAGVGVGLVWAGGELPAASGGSQILRAMNRLARLRFEAGSSFEAALRAPIVLRFRGPVVALTSVAGLERLTAAERGDHRLVTLDAGGFAGHEIAPRPAGAWLHLATARETPEQLRHGWKEARHGG